VIGSLDLHSVTQNVYKTTVAFQFLTFGSVERAKFFFFNLNREKIIIIHIRYSFKFVLGVGVEESIVNTPLGSQHTKNTTT
jgi:hypothetical protein